MPNNKLVTVDNLRTYHEDAQGRLDTALATKQDNLVSSENIKTINGNSVLGAGDIDTTPEAMTTEEVIMLFSDLKKGRILTFDPFGDGVQHPFRIIKVEHPNIVKLLAMEDVDTAKYKYYQNAGFAEYENGARYSYYYPERRISTAQNIRQVIYDYYQSLDPTVFAAIQKPTIIQTAYCTTTPQYIPTGGEPWYYLQHMDKEEINILFRKTQRTVESGSESDGTTNAVRPLDLDEIIEYLGLQTGDTFKEEDVQKMVFNTTERQTSAFWLLSATGHSDGRDPGAYFFGVDYYSSYGLLTDMSYNQSARARVVFSIDMTNIPYTIIEGGNN